MDRTPVSSSNLASVGYDPINQVLEVKFLNESVYQYLGVPASVHSGLMGASSHGTYLDQHFKQAGYAYRKVG